MKKRVTGRFQKSIFSKLMVSFVLYVVLLLLILVGAVLVESLLISRGQFDFDPYRIIDENGNVGQVDTLNAIGGWVEELDADNRVIQVYGTKQTNVEQYTWEEILQLTSTEEDGPYIGMYISRNEGEKRFLAIYPTEVMTVNRTIIINGAEENSGIHMLCIILILFGLVTFLMSTYLRRKIKRPLNAIVDGMQQLQSGNDGARINVKTEAEFQQIVDQFNDMAEELEREKKEKDSITKQKNQTILELSHDLKTPVATIKSYANALKDDLVPEEKKRDIYELIDKKADRVKILTEDMFQLLKMDSPDYQVYPERVEMTEFIRRLVAETYDEVTGNGFSYTFDITDTRQYALLDMSLMSRVFFNLVSNAVKYNKTGQEVHVSLEQCKDNICFCVADDGEKISSEFADQLFRPFARGDQARKTDGGTGLGLAIVKLIVEKHGGSISYRREGDRNVFAVYVPAEDLQ